MNKASNRYRQKQSAMNIQRIYGTLKFAASAVTIPIRYSVSGANLDYSGAIICLFLVDYSHKRAAGIRGPATIFMFHLSYHMLPQHVAGIIYS